MRRPARTRLFAASVVMLATFACVACGGDDDDASATTDVATSEPDATSEPSATSGETDTAGTSDDGTTPAVTGEVGTREDYVEAAKSGFPVEDEDLAACIAEALITDDVYARIQELGVTAADFGDSGPTALGITLNEEQATAMAEEIVACGDLLDALLADDAARACAEEHLSSEQFAQYVSFTLYAVEPSDELQAAYDAMDECVTATATTTS
jgi:hypothetical protein